MKVLILAANNSRNAGGVFNSMRMLGHNLIAHQGLDVQFLLHDDEYSDQDRKYYESMPLHTYHIKGPTNFGYSYDILEKLKNIKPDVVHAQGIWMYFSHANSRYHTKTGTPYIITPHGMLDPWQLKQSFYKNLTKKIVLKLYESKHLKHASCIQALSYSELEAVRSFGLNNPVAIIPNGIELPALVSRDSESVKPPYRWEIIQGRKTLLFLGRIHYKKGLDNLLRAWSLTFPEKHDWQLVIAGETTDKVYMRSLIESTERLGVEKTVLFVGGQFGQDKESCFINADAFILPSFSEGLPVAVLEAWAYKLPVLMTSFCNLPEGFDRKAALNIEPDPESIASGIQNLIALSIDQRHQLGTNGYNLVKEKFTWESVAHSTHQMYTWITGNSEKPDFIHLK